MKGGRPLRHLRSYLKEWLFHFVSGSQQVYACPRRACGRGLLTEGLCLDLGSGERKRNTIKVVTCQLL